MKTGNKKGCIFGRVPGIVLAFLLLLVIKLPAGGQNFSDQTFLIADLTGSGLSGSVAENELRVMWAGLYIRLEPNREGNKLFLNSSRENFSFERFADVLKKNLKENPGRIFPLFIEYTGSVSGLNEAFINAGLSEFVFYLPPGERWPQTEKITAAKKNLVVFTFQKPSPGNLLFHYAWDYIAEYPHSGIEDPLFDGHYINGDISKELLMIRDFEIPLSIARPSQFLLDINQNQFYINHILNRWKNTGKQPNFIFSGKNSWFLSPLIPWLHTYKSVKGVVKIDDRPMEKVFWKHSNKSITNGYFSFPYSEGEELNLTPFSPGFSFDPKTFTVSTENLLLNLAFSANPLSMGEGLTAYFPFDDKWNNYLDPTETIKPVNASFTSDINKGNVAKLSDNSFIVIGKPEKYGIRNNSFTVSSWFKLNKVEMNGEYSILGSPEGVFRKGLHLVIRQGRPYFGFYGNDLWADKAITPNEWFHIVFRYNYFNGEQAIYVNGQNVGASFNHASYIGDSALMVGKSIMTQNYLNGYIDDLYIWNRPIGEEEIRFLYNSEFKPEIKVPDKSPSPMWFVSIIVFLAAGILFVFFRTKKRKAFRPATIRKREDSPGLNKNSLSLFGDFQIYDSQGNELSARFTPKIKELFLIILLYTIKNKKGIKTDKLTSVLWFGFEPQKAANNRSVTFNKLRKILEPVGGLNIEYTNGYWRINLEKGFICDYNEVFSLMEKREALAKQDLERFFSLVKKGAFLNETNYDWLDEFRGFVSNEIIDNLTLLISKLDENENGQHLKEISERILIADDLNEKALQIIIRQLIRNNNLHQAKYRFTHFKNSYEGAYNEPYKLTFNEFREADFS